MFILLKSFWFLISQGVIPAEKNALKGQCHEIFDLWFFSSNNFPEAPDTPVKAF
jgi:hypothetical protein